MDVAITIEAEIDFVELQFGSATHFVQPGNGGIAHEHLALRQQPVAEPAAGAALRLHCNAGDPERAGSVASDLELGAINRQGTETPLRRQQRQPRQHGFDPVQHQRRPAVGAKDLDVHQTQLRTITLPAGLDRTDRDALPDRMHDRLRNRLAIIVDIGQHEVAQSEHQHEKGQSCDQDRIGRDAIGPERTVLEEGEAEFEEHVVAGALSGG